MRYTIFMDWKSYNKDVSSPPNWSIDFTQFPAKFQQKTFFVDIEKLILKCVWRDFPGDPVAKTLHSQCRGPGFNLGSGNYIPHAATKSSHATTKDPVCCN